MKLNYNYVYKITDSKGNFYIGKHTTNNLNDGYMGSGEWIKDAKKKGKKLTKEILKHFNTEKEACLYEEKIIKIHYQDKNNRNRKEASRGLTSSDALIQNNKPEIKDKNRKGQLKRWKNISEEERKEFGKRCSVGSKGKNLGRKLSKENKENISKGMKELYKDEEYKKSFIKITSIVNKRNAKKNSESQKRNWQNPEFRRRMLVARGIYK
jgi:hypothetical protein